MLLGAEVEILVSHRIPPSVELLQPVLTPGRVLMVRLGRFPDVEVEAPEVSTEHVRLFRRSSQRSPYQSRSIGWYAVGAEATRVSAASE
jgi:hypothetical protein